jgi:hypothetical protein
MKKIAMSLLLGLLTVAGYAQWSNPGDEVPAYNAQPPHPGTKLPPILAGNQLTGQNFQYPWQVQVYHEAAKVQAVIHQLPCYCRCDRALGHNSLHSCFEGLHGAECSTCAKEAHYAYVLTKQGKSVQQIREGIIRKDYEKISLESLPGM